MKLPTYTLTFILFCSSEVFSQNTATYNYDSSGNRISRSQKSITKKVKKIHTTNIETANSDTSRIQYDAKQDEILLFTFLNTQTTFYLYNNSGTLLYTQQISRNTENITMSNYPAGTYIASLKIGNKKHTVKFTKK